MLASLYWDPRREMFSFSLPLLGRPILWYGFFFALGFLLGYLLLVYLLKGYFSQHRLKGESNPSLRAKRISEKALVYAMVGTLVGARLFDVFFYQDWSVTWRHPLSVIAVWEGGLASHGGVLGVLVALFLFVRVYRQELSSLSFLGFLDFVLVPSMVIGAFIRVGNFVNQEILGRCTNLPWGVIFGHPADGSFPCPRHPVQLYEALFYLLLGGGVFLCKDKLGKGRVVGLFLALLFSFRFCIEFLKEEQSVLLSSSCLTMGQWLSLPFIGLGVFLFLQRGKKR